MREIKSCEKLKFGRGNIVIVDKRRDTKLIFGLEIILEILIVYNELFNFNNYLKVENRKRKVEINLGG